MTDKKRILAVDDENDVLLILRTALSEEYDVETANNGREAIDMASANPPDLVILDMMMPEMDGLETLAEMKQQDSLSQVPVIFLTGVSDKEKIREALSMGTTYYLVKPFEVGDLLSKVDMAIKESGTTFP